MTCYGYLHDCYELVSSAIAFSVVTAKNFVSDSVVLQVSSQSAGELPECRRSLSCHLSNFTETFSSKNEPRFGGTLELARPDMAPMPEVFII